MRLAELPETPSSDSRAKTWTETLGRVISDLDLLNHDTEQYFLRIGGKLAEFIGAVNQISSELTTLATLISEEQGLRTSQALTSALDHSLAMGVNSEEANEVLCGMRNEADRLKHTLAKFNGTVSTFRMLGVLTRIETARLGSEGAEFSSMADDVKALAANVQARVENALGTAALMIPPLENALQKISALEEGQTKNLPAVISKVRVSLASFCDLQSVAHDSALRLGVQYDAISDAFKRLIVSIQFHDITRQQLEHVIDVLRRLYSESEEGNGSISADPPGTATIVTLQSSQLADAAKKFAASVASIARSLDDIATHVLQMADESRKLSGLSADEHDSFFVQIEQACTAILASLGQCAKTQAATRVTSSGLSETIGRMDESIQEIQAIEHQMQRMGMNARIEATQTGATGNALGVLAEAIQKLAFESRQRSDSLIEAVGSMRQAATRLSGPGEPAPSGESSQDAYLEGMRTAVAEMHSSSERSFAQIGQIIVRGTSLREELSKTSQSFSVGTLFAEAVSHAQKMLAEIGVAVGSASMHGTEGLDRGLVDFAKHYTMQAEIDVYESITRGVGGPANVSVQAKQSELSSKETKGLGDDVEFF